MSLEIKKFEIVNIELAAYNEQLTQNFVNIRDDMEKVCTQKMENLLESVKDDNDRLGDIEL